MSPNAIEASGRRIKILQVLPTLSAGGAEGFVTNLSVSLSEEGASVRLFLLAGVRGERGQVLLRRLEVAGVEVMGIEGRKPASLGNILQLAKLIRSWRPDIVQANLYAAEVSCAAARFLTSGLGTRYVRRLAGTDICGYRRVGIVKLLALCFHLTVSCSSAVEKSFRNLMGPGPRGDSTVIPNGGLLQAALPDVLAKQSAREALGIPQHEMVVAHVGRMVGGAAGSGLASEPKAQDVLLKAFAAAFAGVEATRLVLVGDGPLLGEARRLAEDLGIKKKVQFLGQQPEPWPALIAADIFCFPSRSEGLPNALVEASSCGLPVVASNIPEISSLLPGDAWILKPVDDVESFAAGLLAMHGSLVMYAEKARAAAGGFRDQFSMKACAKKYLSAYEKALG